MLTVQACQQHRLAVMHPNKAKSFPAATVSAVAKLGHRRSGKRGTRSEERRNARRAYASKQKSRRWRSRDVVIVSHPTCRKNKGSFSTFFRPQNFHISVVVFLCFVVCHKEWPYTHIFVKMNVGIFLVQRDSEWTISALRTLFILGRETLPMRFEFYRLR